MFPGDAMLFDGANLLHWNDPNMEGFTRLSIDFRVIRTRDYRPTGARSVNARKLLTVGEYFDVVD